MSAAKPSWMPANLGAEPKKLAILVGLLVVAGIVYFTGGDDASTAGGGIPATAVNAPANPATTGQRVTQQSVPGNAAAKQAPRVARRRTGNADFEPTLLLDDNVDVSKIDPTLKLAVLDRVRSVGDVGGRRSLFEFYDPPPPPPPTVKPIQVSEAKPPAPAPPPRTAEPVKPPPQPIPLKFYGYAGSPQAAKRHAFFLDGEDVYVGTEGDLLMGRYRIVRIGVTSAEVEDVVARNTQTLPIVEMLPLTR